MTTEEFATWWRQQHDELARRLIAAEATLKVRQPVILRPVKPTVQISAEENGR